MSERRNIVNGMAEALWVHLKGGPGRSPRRTPPAAFKAANDLADLYESANDEVLPALFTRQLRRTPDAQVFGYELARAAVERRSMKRSLEGVGIVVPTFEIDNVDGELVWTGTVDDSPRLNPDEWDRDSAKGYGRYAFRMGRNAVQAVADARKQGVPEHLMSAVSDGWGDERRDTIHGGFADNPKTDVKDYTVHEAGAFEGKESHTFERVSHTKSLAEVRQLLARRTKSCSRGCKGWDVFDTNRGFEIQVCDECNALQVPAVRLSDEDVAQLPEAQKKLREIVAENMEENPGPRSGFKLRGTSGEIDVREVDRMLDRYANFIGPDGELNEGNLDTMVWGAGYGGDKQLLEYMERRARARSHKLPGRPPGVPNGRRSR